MVTPIAPESLPPFEREPSNIPPLEPILYGQHLLAAFHRSYPGIAP